jgi:5-methylcytosine-specific restriction endonuclease McrA
MKRRSLTSLQRLKIFEAAHGVCYICLQKITGKWDVEHIIPLALGGADEPTNMLPAHKTCHGEKSKVDAGNLAKANRRRAKHLGAKQSKWPRSKWKRKVSGETVPR